MKLRQVLLAAVFAGATAPSFAADGDACLQNNRIWGWKVVDNRTVMVTDVTHKLFTVKTTGPCIGLDTVLNQVAFKGTLSLGCLQSGDQILYRAPGLGRQSCFIDTVKPGEPEKPADKAHN